MKFYKLVPKRAETEFNSVSEFAKHCKSTTVADRFKEVECALEDAQHFYIKYKTIKYRILIVNSYVGIYSVQNDRGLIPREFVKRFLEQWKEYPSKKERFMSLLLNKYSDISYSDNRHSYNSIVSKVTTSQVASKKAWLNVLKNKPASEAYAWEHGNRYHNKELTRTI